MRYCINVSKATRRFDSLLVLAHDSLTLELPISLLSHPATLSIQSTCLTPLTPFLIKSPHLTCTSSSTMNGSSILMASNIKNNHRLRSCIKDFFFGAPDKSFLTVFKMQLSKVLQLTCELHMNIILKYFGLEKLKDKV